MARPIKVGEEKRSEQVKIRLTLAELERLRLEAAKAGVTLADYVRRRSLDYRVKAVRSSGSDPALISELNRIGVNVNQLARAHHRDSAFVAYWQEIGEELRGVLKRMLSRDGA